MARKYTLGQIKEAIMLRRPAWKIETIEFLGEGDFCIVYLVNGHWICRFAKHDQARAGLIRERCLLPVIQGKMTLQIPFPEYLFLSDSDDLSFIAYRILPGKAMSRKRYLDLPPARRSRCAAQAAGFLNELHAVDLSSAQTCGLPVTDYARHYADLLIESKKHLFSVVGRPERDFIERTIAAYLESKSTEFSPALLHGDLSPEHLIFDEMNERLIGIIDFGDMMIGDPAWDFLWIYEDYGLDFLSRAVRVYNESNKAALLRRIFRFSMLEAIAWAVDCQKTGGPESAESIAQILKFSRTGNKMLEKLLAIAGTT